MAEGKVYLVGAGPGDPGLLTLRGRELLEKAEVVIYDYLANEAFLDYAPPHAERIYVGKKGGDHTLGQTGINDLLVEKGRCHMVVRLKGGDPFVFGRGGEEAQVLAAAGIPFEIVPGVTAAVAVPAYAGIPLSHRDHTPSMAFVTGHEREDALDSKINWEKLATAVGTLVFFMGVKNLPDIAARLTRHGRSPDTPAAVIRWGTTPAQQTVVGTLGDIVEKVRRAALKPPAIIVVGEVVSLREELNWFENRPLFGFNIVVTRAREQASDLKARLLELGAHCIEFPTIQVVPPPSWEPLDEAVRNLDSYHWVIFTSVNGVKFFMERLNHHGFDVRRLAGCRVVAIGPKTSEALADHGVRADFMPGEYRAEIILEGLTREAVDGKNVLLPRAMVARDVLPDTLRDWGARVNVVPAYETVLPEGKKGEVLSLLEDGAIHCITFTSSSTVINFFKMLGEENLLAFLKKTTIACIGPVTAETAREHGLEVHIMPHDYTIPGLIGALDEHFSRKVPGTARGVLNSLTDNIESNRI